MKRLRSSDDLDTYNDKSSAAKDPNPPRSSSRSSSYHKNDNLRKGAAFAPSPFSSSRYDHRDRSGDDDAREVLRMVRKRSDYDFDGADRRKGLGLGFDRYGGGGSSREGYNGNYGGGVGGNVDRGMHRSESFCGGSSRAREFPKGFRSERERSKREGSMSASWRRFRSGSKEFEESGRGIGSISGSRGGGNEERGKESWSSPKGLRRDVKSPTWSRDSGSEQTRTGLVVKNGGGGSGRDEKVKSSNSKSRSSPSWSKDSESEQSKSVEAGRKSVEVDTKSVEVEVEVKSVGTEVKNVEMEVKSTEGASGSGSEMEEGELEREPDSVDEVAEGNKNHEGNKRELDGALDVDQKEEGGDTQTAYQVSDEGNEAHETSVYEGKDVVKEVDETPKHNENANGEACASEDEVRNVGGDEMGKEGEAVNMTIGYNEEESKDVVASPEVESKRGKGFDLEAKVEDNEDPESIKEAMEDNGGVDLNLDMMTVAYLKDKGKSVAVSPSHIADSAKDNMQVEIESGNLATCRDREDDMEGPSTRGFELFSTSPVRRVDKAEQSGVSKSKDDKLTLEPLDLSLSLPNVLLPIGATIDSVQAPGSPSQGRSVHSFSTFRTNSDGFTASMSFSGSQSFFHNPSCSLTQNSLDMENFEQSVHSRPIFKGIDQGTLQNDSKPKDEPLYQRILANGNGSLPQSQALQGVSNGQTLQGSSKMPNGLERQVSFHKHLLSGQARNHDDTRSPAQSVGSHDIDSMHSFEKKLAMREKHGGSLYRSSSQKEKEPLLIGGSEFVETIISKIVSDPIYVMAKKFHEMSAQSALILKESIGDIMVNADKQVQLRAFQSALQDMSDLTLDMLLKAHRVQLEILVSLKTGLKEYLQLDSGISSSALAEIFLNLRCRNPVCQSPLPVDECDCKVCSKKSGFCSACMCLVCSKFDMASNTCSWIGCDVCLHWCHADCALRESFIRNGRSASGVQGTPEMQFHCVACDHPSEMFGFVKEVFQNFAKVWSAETFCKELEYVRRIFSASKDVRGRVLCKFAHQMLAKLANKSTLPDVYSFTMSFLNESDFSKFGNTSAFLGKEQGNGSNGVVAGPSQDPLWFNSVYTEKTPQVERSDSLLPSFSAELNDKHLVDSKPHRSIQKEPIFDELERIVRIKQVEAEMFQARADDARREAEGLRRISVAKNEKIEEEYNSRIAKLRLVEAEEMRKQKFEEFQALERAHREYFCMKMRMETDIKDLLAKMEVTKRSLAM